MRAIVMHQTGEPEVLRLVPLPAVPGAEAAGTVIPSGVSPAGAVAAAPAAVALGLLETAALTGGETVLAESGASAVGGYLIQLAREMGAGKVIATAGTPARREHAHKLGADIVLDHAQPGWPGAMREALDGSAVDVAFESIGGPSAQRVLGTLTPGTGRMLCYGNLSGEEATVDLAALRGSGVTVTGCGGSAWFGHILGRCRPEIFRRLAQGRLRPLPATVLPLDQAAQAHQRIEDHAAQGKIILAP
jgi:NADPH:quinone reductase